MATIVVEDGSGLTNSNSYISEADLTTYATDRGITLTGTAAVLLIQAMDYVESQSFKGDKLTDEQALQWPRFNVKVDRFYIPQNEIPQLLVEATAEVAISIDSGTNPLANQGRETIKEKVDVIEVEYSTSARAVTFLTAAETKLRKLVIIASNRVIRG